MEVRVQIVRFVMEHWPSIVEWELVDADGRSHIFIGKDAMCSMTNLDSRSAYPQSGGMRCIIIESWRDVQGRELARVSTAHPDDLESTDGVTEFVVLRSEISPWPEPIQVR